MIEGIIQGTGNMTVKTAAPERTRTTQDFGGVFASKLQEARNSNAKANERPQTTSADKADVKSENVASKETTRKTEEKKIKNEAQNETPVVAEEFKEETKAVDAALLLLNGLIDFLTQGETVDPAVQGLRHGIEAKIEALTANGSVDLSALVDEVNMLLQQIPENAEGEEALTQFLSFLEENTDALNDDDRQAILNQMKHLMKQEENPEEQKLVISETPHYATTVKTNVSQAQAEVSSELLKDEAATDFQVVVDQGDQQASAVKGSKELKHQYTKSQKEEASIGTSGNTHPLEGAQITLKGQIATPKAAEVAPLEIPEVEITEIIQQIVHRVEIDMKEGKSEMRIQLMPENLGDVLVRISMDKGNLSAKVVTENAQIKELIDQNLDQLRINLGEKGINVSSLEVSVDQNPHAFAKNQTYNQYKARIKGFRNNGARTEGVGGSAYQESTPVQNPYQISSNFDALA